MKIVVIGGTGLIGSKTVERLRKKGHDVLAASPNSGVDTITGTGLAEALAGARVVLDLANSPSFEDNAVLEFFRTAGRNLLSAGAAAGVEHHVALSIVGTERLQGSGYMRAKMAQEELIKSSGIPYTIVHSTQFFEFMDGIAQAATIGQTVHLSSAYVQPIASDDVADVMADVALASPANGTIEIGGPEKVRLNEIVARLLAAKNDARQVVADPHARYFGVELKDESLVPGSNARLGRIRFNDWLSQHPPRKMTA
ncbi:NmrA family transcriptional regulator [Sinorhizobium glycinis]|uniref:NmrA family transcriptional regulator n=1 Tax=Sinorhizobium glycinis TaxID=1472378 RepID=A0A178XMZ5_9HYPH|nr:SDR family oxidoreductase [Sinorhizobium glycinis]OAP36576.1 NmrA family transcriptional regulator [Sinorhizobium glycinis]